MRNLLEREHWLSGSGGSPDGGWEPRLLLREQSVPGGVRRRPVLYVHGATFPSACSFMLRFDGTSWADHLTDAGFSAWALDLAGYGGSERYPEMEREAPGSEAPLGRAGEAARQVARAVDRIVAETGCAKVSLIAHSWGTIVAGVFATRHPELVERIVFFGPIVGRRAAAELPRIAPWRLLTVAEQRSRFVEDVPAGHPPVLLDRHFAAWAAAYLASDPTSTRRAPPSVRTPNGPVADILAAQRGAFAYDPAMIQAPLAVIRGEWDSLCSDDDAAWLVAALTSSPVKRDVVVAKGTHLLHLEEGRASLHRAALGFFEGE